jgi:hypothetical protein
MQSLVLARMNMGSGVFHPFRTLSTSPHSENMRCCGKCHPALLYLASIWNDAAR